MPALSFRVALRRLCAAVLAGSVAAGFSTFAVAATTSIKLPNSAPFPESVTSTSDGTLFVSSISNGGVVRVRPGSEPEIFIKPGAYETRSTFGVHADERSGTLWVCSNDASTLGIKGPNTIKGAYLKAFDLKTGQIKASYRLPQGPAICNDTAFGPDGSVYVTNTAAPQILKLAPGAKDLSVWLTDPVLKGGLDGIAFGKDGDLYVNTYLSGELFRIAVKDGAPGAVTKLATSRALTHPDALRAIKGGFLMVEGAGTLDHVTLTGDQARVESVKPFAGPTGVTVSGDTIWVSEGKLDQLQAVAKGAPSPAFYLRSLSLADVRSQ
jgi:sugar lactone lactonase YvrE